MKTTFLAIFAILLSSAAMAEEPASVIDQAAERQAESLQERLEKHRAMQKKLAEIDVQQKLAAEEAAGQPSESTETLGIELPKTAEKAAPKPVEKKDPAPAKLLVVEKPTPKQPEPEMKKEAPAAASKPVKDKASHVKPLAEKPVETSLEKAAKNSAEKEITAPQTPAVQAVVPEAKPMDAPEAKPVDASKDVLKDVFEPSEMPATAGEETVQVPPVAIEAEPAVAKPEVDESEAARRQAILDRVRARFKD